MTISARVVSAAVVDARGIAGSSGTKWTWRELGIDLEARACGWPRRFEPDCPNFRRMDLLSRSVLLATEVAGVGSRGLLADKIRTNTALLSASSFGCLDSDVRFASGLGTAGEVEPAVFSYTLASTCLGEVAIRHGITGPSYALSVRPGDERQGLIEARSLLAHEEASAAVVFLGDAVKGETARAVGIEPHWRIAAFVVVANPEVSEWLAWDDAASPDVLARVAERLWR